MNMIKDLSFKGFLKARNGHLLEYNKTEYKIVNHNLNDREISMVLFQNSFNPFNRSMGQYVFVAMDADNNVGISTMSCIDARRKMKLDRARPRR